MAALNLFWSAVAIAQRKVIFDYWNDRNKNFSYSRKLNSQINERLQLLKQNPDIGKPSVIDGVWAISLGHFSIIYEYSSSSIVILSFWDNRQDPGKLLSLLEQ
jgi:plasmid stabilization system protein ParE